MVERTWPHPMMQRWSGRAVTDARAMVAATLPAPCPYCPELVTADDRWDVDHAIPRVEGIPGPIRAAHASCNRSAGARLAQSRRAGIRRWPA